MTSLLGGKDLWGQELPRRRVRRADAQSGDVDTERDSDLSTLTGLRLETASSQASTLAGDDPDHRPLAAPAGWRRFWGIVENASVYVGDPDITLSPFCKPCYDRGEAYTCNMTSPHTTIWEREAPVVRVLRAALRVPIFHYVPPPA